MKSNSLALYFVAHLNMKSNSLELKLVAHLNLGLLTPLNRLQNFEAILAWGQINCEVRSTFRLSLNVQILHRHFKSSHERPLRLEILEVENGALVRIEQLVEGLGVLKEGGLLVVDTLGKLDHLCV